MLTLTFGKNAAEETIGLQRCKKDSLDKGRELFTKGRISEKSGVLLLLELNLEVQLLIGSSFDNVDQARIDETDSRVVIVVTYAVGRVVVAFHPCPVAIGLRTVEGTRGKRVVNAANGNVDAAPIGVNELFELGNVDADFATDIFLG